MFGKSFHFKTISLLALFLVVLLILPQLIPRFYVYIASLILVTGLVAMSLNLAIGHGGIYQFNHGVFYGVGAYTAALVLVKTSWPAWVAFALGPVVAMLVGFLIGLFCVRLTRLYFGMLQISLGSLVWAIVFRWYNFTGGDDGIHGIPIPPFLASVGSAYYFTLIILVISLCCLYLILNSSFGMTLQAIRDNPERCGAVGINVKRHQLFAICIATFFAGVSGVLFVVVERSVFPDLLFWVFSLEIFIMCLLGGWFTFAGPMVGAAIIIALRTSVSIHTEYWTLILGVILIVTILFLPEGLLGFFLKRISSHSARSIGKG